MDIDYLHTICKKYRKEVAEDYQNKILNPIFPLSDDIIDIEIEDMRQIFMQKIMSKMYNNYSISIEQHKVLDQIAESYINVAIVKGRKFAEGLVRT